MSFFILVMLTLDTELIILKAQQHCFGKFISIYIPVAVEQLWWKHQYYHVIVILIMSSHTSIPQAEDTGLVLLLQHLDPVIITILMFFFIF